ncbi:MAG: Ig-like domain-containing protein, partial [Armatimonadia bacterium]
DGSFTYTPNAGFTGDDSFTYTANDGLAESAAATVTIHVTNTAPAALDDDYNTTRNKQLVVAAPGVLTNDTDTDSDALTAVKVSDTANGTVTLNVDGSFTYTPNAGFTGDDSFTYQANDGVADSAAATVTIHVSNTTTVATDDSYNGKRNNPLVVAAPGVLSNDSDDDGDALTAIKLTDPANGSVALNTDGSFTYTPNADFMGDDSFTYQAHDGVDGSAAATVTLHITNTAPTRPVSVLISPSVPGKEDLTGNADGSTDADGDTLTYEYEWTKLDSSGTRVTGWTSNRGRVLPASKVNFGETWQVRARAFDGTVYSPWKVHKTATIVRMVTYLTPVANAVNVPLNSYFQITFKWPVNQLSVNQRLRLYKGASLVAGSAQWIVPNQRVRFVPKTALAPNTVYTLRLNSGIICTSGRVLGWSESYDFTTVGPALSTASVGAMTVAAAPTAQGAQVTVNLSNAATVRAVVCNIAGRVVAELPERDLPSGVSSLLWNGKSRSGSNVPSGSYLVRVTAMSADGAQTSAVTSLSLHR